MTELTAQLENLARKRMQMDELSAKRDVLRETVDEYLLGVPEYIELEKVMQDAKVLAHDIKNLEDTIKEHEVESANKYKGYLPPVGITIKNFKILKVSDDKKAKVWLASNAPALLSYSDSKLLKAVENLEIDWAIVETEARAQIASNLSQYLENNENE